MKTTWKECTAERYYEMRCVLPPECWTSIGFLVGEASDHRTCSVRNYVAPTFAPFAQINGKFYEAMDALTLAEFKKLTPADVVTS